MVNINLLTGANDQASQQEKAEKNGRITVITILVLAICIYAGFVFWKNNLVKQANDANVAYKDKYEKLKTGVNLDVIDLQNRIFLSRDLVALDKASLIVLDNIEKGVVSGVHLEVYKNNVDTKSLYLKGIADNHDAVARQALSFKKLEAFSDVLITETKVLESGEIEFVLNIKFK